MTYVCFRAGVSWRADH